MAGLKRHSSIGTGDQRWGTLTARLDCEGELKRLYVRRTKPQRWIATGWVCTGCGTSSVDVDALQEQPGEGRKRKAAAELSEEEADLPVDEYLPFRERVLRLPMAVPRSRRPTHGRK